MTGRIDFTLENVRHTAEADQTGRADPQDRVDVVLIEMLHFNRECAVYNQDNFLEHAGIIDDLQHICFILVQCEAADALFIVRADVDILACTAADYHDGSIAVICKGCLELIGIERGGTLDHGRTKEAGTLDLKRRLIGSIQRLIDLESLFLHSVIEADNTGGINVATAGAVLIERIGGRSVTEQGNPALTLLQRQCMIVVAQKYCAFFLFELDEGVFVSKKGIQVFLGQMIDIAIVTGIEDGFFLGCTILVHKLPGRDAKS